MTPEVFDPARPRGYVHAREKLAERYGLELSPDEHLRLSRMASIADPRAVHLSRLSNGRLMVAYHLGGDWVPAVWSPTSETIVTFRLPARLDRYRAMLATIDPETGKAKDDGVEPKDGGVRPQRRPFVGGIIEQGTGVLPAKWITRKPCSVTFRLPPSVLAVLPDEAVRLAGLWVSRISLDGPLPEDIKSAADEWTANVAEIAEIERERNSGRYPSEDRSLCPALGRWYVMAGRRTQRLCDRNSRLLNRFGRRIKRDSSKTLAWWQEYVTLGNQAGCGPTTDPTAILIAAAAAIKELGRRLDWAYTEQERATQNLISRWLIINQKGPPPDFIDAAAQPDATEQTHDETTGANAACR